MPSLLDLLGKTSDAVLGTVPNVYSGLLSEDELRAAKSRAQSDALANMANAFYAAGEKGTGTGRALLQGLSAGRGGFDEALKGQVQEKLNQQKIQQALQGQKRAAEAQNLLSGAFQPAQPANVPMMNGMQAQGPVMPATPARFNLESIAPQLMQTAEGRAALADVMGAQKAMRPEMFTLAEGAKQFARDASGNIIEVAAGAPKTTKPDLAASFAGAVDALGLPRKNASEYSEAERTAINKEMARQRAESKMSFSVSMPSEGERKAGTLASRLNFSVAQMNEAIGKDPSAAKPDTLAEAAGFLSQTNWLPNKLNSEQRQVVEAAQEDILDAALTLGTGAAYTREQLAGYKKSYFPQIGDNDATVKSKQARLMNLLETAQLASGRAASQITTPIPSAVNLQNISLSDLRAEQKRREDEAGKR